MGAPRSWRITYLLGSVPDGREWAVYDTDVHARTGGSSIGPFRNDPSVVFAAATEGECWQFLACADQRSAA